MAKPLTKIRSNMNLKAAHTMRAAELAAHAATYAEACRQTNEAFAIVVRREAEKTSLSDVARQLDISRINLHHLVRKSKVAAAA